MNNAPIGISNPPDNKPMVKDYPVDPYYCKPGDFTFADVSNKLYGSDKYARALLLFNRDDPRAKDNIMREPVRLVEKQAIYYPPREILESRYAAVISDVRPALPVPAPSPTNKPAIVVGTPMPLITNPGSPSNFQANPPLGTPPAAKAGIANDNTKRYRVRDNGEWLLEIARQTLGDSRRWSEIYRLNPSIRPEYPIPGGTDLRLPGTANVP